MPSLTLSYYFHIFFYFHFDAGDYFLLSPLSMLSDDDALFRHFSVDFRLLL